ncbi:hypothetical protein FSPOR_8936 [Fusarium sporotrichioides]|uniref:Major facilitator superfamily (MFS) profile domain-containing protein n=1 Tax=Fusarium sporotrichioides TaxID=5514 RepID=A0A395RSZ4_FUSSP|nr:hypothetical protein FSPOR_8936 [Fusarium sporotrichioides]
MALGVLESKGSTQPSGTVLLEDLRQNGEPTLVFPQPSSSAEDPLNMSRLRKELYFLTLLFGACVTGVLGPVIVPAFGIVSQAFHTSLTHITLLNGSLVLALGVSSFVSSVISDLWGRRLIFLLTSIMLVVSCIWAAVAQGYESLLAARVFQGLSMGPFFSLAGTSCVNDVFFLHERGLRVGLWNFAIIVSVNIAPVISGYLIVDMGWRWAFWFLAIAFGVGLVMVVFLLPETKFDRREITESNQGHTDAALESVKIDKTEVDEESSPAGLPSVHVADLSAPSVTKPRCSKWRKFIGLQYTQSVGAKGLLSGIIKPFMMLRHPAVIWGCIMWSITFTWVIVLGAVASQIFGAPPYSLNPSEVGLVIGIAPLIGSALGTILSGWMSDVAARYMSAFNGGLYEPEFRLVVIAPATITMAIGAFGLAAAIENAKPTIVCCVYLALINFGVGSGCTGIVTYTNDVCMDRAGHAFGLAMFYGSL